MYCMTRTFGVACFLAVLWCFAAHAAEIKPPQEAAGDLAASVRSLDLQTSITASETWNHGEPWRLPKDAATVMLWGSAAVLAAVALLTLKNSLWSASRSRPLGGDYAEEAAPAAARMDIAQVEADDLARTGNFAEAMHVLLLQSVGELRRLDAPIGASLTSREILVRARLSPTAKTAFADIIGRVEISWFGAHEPGEEEYRACRRSFETLSAALAGRGAA